MEKLDKKPADGSPLSGPSAIRIDVQSPRGPLAKKTARLTVPETIICLLNQGAQPVSIKHVAFDPLQHSETGALADASLAIAVKNSELAAGESTPVTVSGQITAAPGVYVSMLRIPTEDGAPLSIRVEFHVAAIPAWAFACMILGLSLVGFITLLDGESGVQGELHRALDARQTAHEFLQRTPPPQSRSALVEDIHREFDTAISGLQKPRELSFVDHRIADAQEHLQTAKNRLGELHKDLSAKPVGSVEVSELAQEWTSLQAHFSALSKRFLVPAPQGTTFAERLDGFDVWAAQRVLKPAITYYDAEFGYQVNSAQLLYAAGRGPDSAAKAIAIRRWMQRAADVVNTQAQLLMFFVQQSANDLTTAERIRLRAKAEGIAATPRDAILGSLDKATLLMSEPFNWPLRATVAQLIQKAHTEMMRAEAAATVAAAKMAGAQEEKEDSIEGIQKIIDEGAKLPRGADGKIDAKAKIAWLRRGVAAWRERLATLPDPDPPALRAELDALEQAIDAGNLDAVSAHTRGLFEQWASYGSARATAMILKATAPFCLRLRDDTLVSLEATQQTMRRLEGNSSFRKWESELDRLRMKTQSTPDAVVKMPINCLDLMGELFESAYKVSNDVTSAMWNAATLPESTKHDLAAELGGSLTPDVLQSLISDTRPLHIEVTTAPEERYVGRQIEFRIGNIEPIWGLGVNVRIDFGDGHDKTQTAEDLRKNNAVTHAYAEPKSYTLAVVAAETLEADAMRPSRKTLGEGQLQNLVVQPSPVSVASRLADIFFNLRFALALLVAGLFHFWRYRSTKDVFGARSFDYAQAFALGFAVSLAVNDLPQKLVEFIK